MNVFYPAILCAIATALSPQPVPSFLYSALKWRLIGPFRARRVEAVSGVPGQPSTFYFGAVGGGLWKKTDTGDGAEAGV